MDHKTCRIGFQVQLVSSRLVAWNQAPDWGKAGKKRGRAGEKEKKGNQDGERNEPWSQARTLVNLIQNTKSTRLVRGEQGSKRVKLNINNNTPKTIKATGVLLLNRTDKETFSFWGRRNGKLLQFKYSSTSSWKCDGKVTFKNLMGQ